MFTPTKQKLQAGSVLECPDGYGGSLLIRIQNMAATGKNLLLVFLVYIIFSFINIIILYVET
jgi:hypothetical protein